MPVFKMNGNGSTMNTKTGKTFRWKNDEPVFISDGELSGLKHIRPRMTEVRPTMVPVEPVLPTESLSEITSKRGRGRPRK